MTTIELLLAALTLAVAVLAVAVLVRRKPASNVGAELAVADRLQGIQTVVAEGLAKATKEVTDQRTVLTERVALVDKGLQESLARSAKELADQRLHAAEAQKKQELAFIERMTKLEKGIQESVANAQKEVATTKEQMDKNAIEFNKFMASLGQTIEKLTTQQQAAAKFSEDLKFLLEGPKSRGTFGETILEEMLERTLPEGIWHRQYQIEGREAVDAAIELKGTIYPIDSKFPKEDYQRYLRAGTDEERTKAWKGYESALKTQIDSISRKYVKPEAGTANFALLFIPSEGIYYETIADTNHLGEPNSLMEYAYGQRVVPVGPNTFFAFLQIIVKGVEGQKLVDNARHLQENLAKVRSSFEKFYAKYEDTGRHIGKAAEAFRLGDGHVQRFKDRLDGVLEGQLLADDVEPMPVLAPPTPKLIAATEKPAPAPAVQPIAKVVPTVSAAPKTASVPTPVPTPAVPASRPHGPKAFKVED